MAVGLVSMAAYARMRKVSHEAVRKAVKAGRITLIDGNVDPDVADIQWERNTRKAIGRSGMPATDATPHSSPMHGDGAASSADAASNRHPDAAKEHDYEASRAKREYHEAHLAEMKALERAGQLVESQRVRMAVADIARVMADGLARIPDRVASSIHAAMTPADIHTKIDAEVAEIRRDLLNAVQTLSTNMGASAPDA
ncbi:MAG: hypothetical protein HKL99_05580 [Burkholderiales bacterium]|jgi:hypothetical protein|nr:hypothetical protein [Burkholderiales bacterium]